MRVTSAVHPLFGRLLEAASFKRWNGELLLVVTLPDGSPGTVRACDTGVFGVPVEAGGAGVVLDAAGIRELARLVSVVRCSAGREGSR